MYETEDEKQSYQLEKKADLLMVDVMQALADAADKRCLVHGRTRYIDKALLNKCVHLIMIYDDSITMKQLSKKVGLSFSTFNRILSDNGELTANRLSVEKIINYMNEIARTLNNENNKKTSHT